MTSKEMFARFALVLGTLGASVIARAEDCDHLFTGKLRRHVKTRPNAPHHTLISALAEPSPLWAASFLLRWNVIADVEARWPGWAAQGLAKFIAEHGHRVEVIDLSDVDAGRAALARISVTPGADIEPIWLILDFTGAPPGRWLDPSAQPFWEALYDRRGDVLLGHANESNSILLPLILLPDRFDEIPEAFGRPGERARPDVGTSFGYHSMTSFTR